MKNLLPVLVLFFIFSCKKDEPVPEPIELALNGELEVEPTFSTGWWKYAPSPYHVTWTSEFASSGNKSVKISTEVSESHEYAYWGEQICDNVQVGKKIVLKVKVKANLVGTGISLALRADDSRNSNTGIKFVTTQQSQSITGTFDWQEFSVEMSSVPDGTVCLNIFLVYLQNTTGEVYFDDVSLTYQ